MQSNTIQGFRLSPQQRHLWLLQANNSVYRAQCAIYVEGNLNLDYLKAAVEQVINKHKILRTNFHCIPGMKMPIMVVEDRISPLWQEIQLIDGETTKIERLFQDKITQNHNNNITLYLIKLSLDKYILIINLPALCADYWTLYNLVKEISITYSECLKGQKYSDLEVVQYVQFAEWQNQLLKDEVATTENNYWLNQDFSSLAKLQLPFEDQNSQQTAFVPASFKVALSDDITTKLELLVQQYDSSTSVFLLACWQILLWRLTKQPEIIIGKACDGREYAELHDALGLFAKWLPIRSQLNTNLCFKEVVELAQKVIEAAEEWQDYFVAEKLIEQPEKGIVFPFGFEFVEFSQQFSVDEVVFSLEQQYTCIEPFKVKLVCLQNNDSLLIEFHYDTNLYSTTAIQNLAEQFQTLLFSAIANPEVAISKLAILSAIAQHQLLLEFNNTQTDYPLNKCIHQLFAEQVAKTPNHLAVVFEQEQLTYTQLNARANKIARYLQKLGVGPEVIVAVYLERSLHTITAMLGILKAGGAYLVIDQIPKQGLALRLQDAQISIILTQQTLVATLPTHPAQIICLDSEVAIAQESCENVTSKVTSNNLVYVVYTSGSTGKPKGVAIEHRQLLNYFYAISDKLALPNPASFATVSTFAADLGNTAIFPALCTGGCLHIISQERATDTEALADYFHRHQIDCLKIVPSHLAALLTSTNAKSILPRLRLILGGEAASWHLIEQIRQLMPECQILNHYGPTETTVGVLTYLVNNKQNYTQTVPLGRPLANTQVYVLDEELQPVPIGVPGELYIGGVSVARGYLNSPQLTKERFMQLPASNQSAAKLYKTGDIVRYLPDGNLEFLGRVDYQVKLRGFRIELGEIEALLSQYPQVQQAVVTVREDRPGDKRLVAYVVSRRELDTSQLHQFLQEKLPEYMIPTAFVLLKTLPLTANGKVNRQALPTPEQTPSPETFVAPRNPVEEVLIGIWAEILSLKRVGIDDDFFTLGGHSLLATQAISRIRKAFAVELPLRQLFETPTVAGLAKQIETAMKAGEKLQLTDIKRVSRDREIPLSFAQQRLWFLEQLNPGGAAYNLSRAIRITGKLNIAALQECINEILQRHEVLRTSFAIAHAQPVQKIASSLQLNIPVIDLQELPTQAAEIQRLATLEAQQGFDLMQAPLLRMSLLKLAAEEHVVLFTMHHIVCDGWSTGVLIRELTALYQAYSYSYSPLPTPHSPLPITPNPHSPLPTPHSPLPTPHSPLPITPTPHSPLPTPHSPLTELPIQYADFAIWQRQWLVGEVLKNQLAYWKQQLQDLPVLELPTDRPRPAMQTFRGETRSLLLPQALTQALKACSQKQGVTLFMTLLAAFKTLLYRYTAQTDIAVGSPIANRNRGEIEDLIGFFVNTLVLRTNLSSNPTFSQLLVRIREVTLGAYTHQDLPFEKLVEELHWQRDLSRAPLFGVMFVFENAPMPDLELPGLVLQPLEINTKAAKFDLTLYMVETQEGLTASLEYNSDLFDAATITRMLGHFQTLLEGICVDTNQHLSDLPLLTPTEQQQLLVTWNNTQANYPNQCIHELFAAQVEQSPDAVAVIFENEQLTYRELNTRANQLAHYLQQLGIGAGVLVGICIERSAAMIVGLLGILKAGGAYVPLDPAYPQERLNLMLKDSQVSVLLTQQHLVGKLTESTAKIICIDTGWLDIAQHYKQNPTSKATPDHPAYAIYTSGSTSTPKAVLGTHRGAVNRFAWMWKTYPFTPKEICCQKTSLSFVDSVWEIFGPLLQGIPLVLIPDLVIKEPQQFLTTLASHRVTRLVLVPALLRLLLDTDTDLQQRLPDLKLWVTSGEALAIALLQRFRQSLPESILLNLYGSSEVAADVTCDCSSPQDQIPDRVLIGGAIANTQIYLLDAYLQPVPMGVVGELYIGGDSLSLGYLHQPELTAQKFISNPFEEAGGERGRGDAGTRGRGESVSCTDAINRVSGGSRLYKTGDLARYLPDGNLEFVGRCDRQIKLRGFRIELSEIEATLSQYQGVGSTIAMIREDQPNHKRIVAYIVPRPESNLTSSNIHHFLSEKLPEYMLPNAYVFLDKLPLLPNGKINQSALPAPGDRRPEQETIFVAPQTPTQEKIAQIWTEILSIKQVGIDDDFFLLGGHSLLATQLISRIYHSFGVQLSLRDLFISPKICSLAEKVETALLLNANIDTMLDQLETMDEEEVQKILALDE
ncbi:MAG: amino acid adenylation domain-containing protein [Desmonostoc vinosum HA7617-LM4]|jgi:amino acid adenylation domain-containing protein|nr:amino acid adenylation domain-containing protein [Desmonostoc vinosum HA7617-LM4]